MERLNEHEPLKDTCNKTIDAFLELPSKRTLKI